ncbi:TIGR03667 family PPOX class F420-dependent oxidoreductase [Actinopolymorpha alba]|uniref:TIGR03667 family PPOX class F420-dependent oxidoreductase n=1 Tax=Actinopolymorpha alba TaxID=533267 RepID=UPI00035F1129|nr:TIGR03667 family PPOX class F420-dependent oxidoreductase [Actinopolymorpha alba]
MFGLDTSTEFGRHVAKRLERDTLIWITTVGTSSRPFPTLVWFLWTGSEFLIFSQADKPKLTHVAHNPRAALHLESNGQGGDVVIFSGTARLDLGGPTREEEAAYKRKYTRGISGLGMTYEEFRQSYSQTVRFTPERLRGWV